MAPDIKRIYILHLYNSELDSHKALSMTGCGPKNNFLISMYSYENLVILFTFSHHNFATYQNEIVDVLPFLNLIYIS